MNYIIVSNTIRRPGELVARCLRAALAQPIPPLKVILIDQNPEPLPLPAEITEHPLFERQTCAFGSVSAARNSLRIPPGVEWICFCDDDGYMTESYSETLAALIAANPRLDILAGSILREDTKEYYSLRHRKGGSLRYFRNTKNLMGSNFVVRVETFRRLGGFDERFGAGAFWGSGEESDFCWNAYFAEVPMEFYRELAIMHVPPFNESIRKGFRKSYRYGVGKGGLVWKWLIRKRQPKVLFELAEMFVVPFVQIARGCVTLKPGLIVTNFATIAGRVTGLFKAPFVA